MSGLPARRAPWLAGTSQRGWDCHWTPVNGGRPRPTRRLRSEKPHQQLGRRGFDSRHLQECSGSFREHCWRCARPSGFVTIENRPSPLDRVADSNSRRLRSGPEFEVFRPIVITHTIAVVNRFAGLQVSTEQLLDNENVFEHVRTRSCARVVGHSHHDVAGLVEGSPHPSNSATASRADGR